MRLVWSLCPAGLAAFSIAACVTTLEVSSEDFEVSQPDPQAGILAAKIVPENSAAIQEDPWGRIFSPQITPDGRWFIYLFVKDTSSSFGVQGRAEVVLRDIRSDSEWRFQVGDYTFDSNNIKMSSNGQWIAFPTTKIKSAIDAPHGPVSTTRNGVTWLNVDRKKETTMVGIQEFAFVGTNDDRILLKKYTSSAESDYELIIRGLSGGDSVTFPHVKQFAVNMDGSRVAYVDDAGIHVYNVSAHTTTTLDAERGRTYTNLVWSDTGSALAVLRSPIAPSEANGRPQVEILTFMRVDDNSYDHVLLAPHNWDGFPAGSEISTSTHVMQDYSTWEPLIWRDDEQGLFFWAHSSAPGSKESIASGGNLALWHWKDVVPARKEASAQRLASSLYYVSLKDRHFVRLSDPTLQHVRPHPNGQFVLGYDPRPYTTPNGLGNPGYQVNTTQKRDYYLVSLRDGKRKIVERQLPVPVRHSSVEPQLSPDGAFVIYQDDQGDYIAYDTINTSRKNLTANTNAKFYFDENSPNKPGHDWHIRASYVSKVLVGFSKNGNYVLLSDFFDIWALPLKGGEAINLTRNGRHDNVTYDLLSIDSVGFKESTKDVIVDLEGPLYFSVHDHDTWRQGLAHRGPNQPGLDLLQLRAAKLSYLKARQADVFVSSIVTSRRPRDFYLLDQGWEPIKQLTDANPKERASPRWPEARYITYETTNGDQLAASLRLPIGYDTGRSYPTIVEVYEEGIHSAYEYVRPGSDTAHWLQNGFAILSPQIRPRVNEPGQAAVEAVTAAVDAAAVTGVIDTERLGIRGHSYGGYETYYIVSQTSLFKAAVPSAGFTNLWSFYGSLRGPGVLNSATMEHGQPFMDQPPWKDWDVYFENSPLYYAEQINTPLLIVHGDQDEAAPFAQAVELFNALHRMGNKPVVLLQYVGSDHVAVQSSLNLDVRNRQTQFFDHFLKGKPAPDWWADGMSIPAGQVPSVRLSNSVH